MASGASRSGGRTRGHRRRGIIGASIAYHLARRGAQVTLLEKLRPACGATEKSFAWINATFSKQPREYFHLNLLGMYGWRRLQRELPGELPIQWGGSVEWYPAGAEAEELRHAVPRHQSWGYATRLIDEPEFQRLMPNLTPGAPSGCCCRVGPAFPPERNSNPRVPICKIQGWGLRSRS